MASYRMWGSDRGACAEGTGTDRDRVQRPIGQKWDILPFSTLVDPVQRSHWRVV